MTTVNERPAVRRGGLRIDFLRRAAIGAAVALVGLMAAISPAYAAASTDGTSNTINVAVTSVTLDQAHNRVVVTAPAHGGLTPGMHLAIAQVVTPHLVLTLQNTLVSGVASTLSSLSLNFTKIETAIGPEPCRSGMDACLMETDGLSFPAADTGSVSWDIQQAKP